MNRMACRSLVFAVDELTFVILVLWKRVVVVVVVVVVIVAIVICCCFLQYSPAWSRTEETSQCQQILFFSFLF